MVFTILINVITILINVITILINVITILINVITLWKSDHFLIRVRRLQRPSLAAGPHMLCILPIIFEEWAGRYPDKGLKSLIMAGPPVVQQVEDLLNLNLGWVLPLKTIGNTFFHDPGSGISR